MNGSMFLRAGWDMHGLPIEVKVEGVLVIKIKKTLRNTVSGFRGKMQGIRRLSHRDK